MAPSPADEVLAASVRVALGLVVLVAAAVAAVIRRVPAAAPVGSERGAVPLLALATGASCGAALAALGGAGRVARGGWTAVRWGTRLLPTGPLERATWRTVERWDRRWDIETNRSREIAVRFLDALVPEAIDATLDRLDLTALVRDRLDLTALVSSIDTETIAATFDLAPIVERIDVEAIVARLDVNDIAARLDVDAVARRVDAVSIAKTVVDELDLPEMIRASTTTITTDAVDDLRMGAIDADRALSRAVDRLFRRNGAHGSGSVADPSSTSGPIETQ